MAKKYVHVQIFEDESALTKDNYFLSAFDPMAETSSATAMQ